MNKALVSVSLVAIGLISGYFIFEARNLDATPSPQAPAEASESSSKQDQAIAALRSEVEQLRKQIAALAQKRRASQAEPKATFQFEPTPDSGASWSGEDDWLVQQSLEEDEARDLEEEEQAEAISHGYREQAQRHHEQEVRDNQWAELQESQIQQILADGQDERFEGLVLDYLQCRSSSCMIELDLSLATAPHAEMVLVGELGGTLPHATWEKDGDRLKLVLSTQDLAADSSE